MALAFLLMALQAPALALLILTGVTGLIAAYLCVRYQGDLRAANVAVVPQSRGRLDLMVAGDMRAAIAVGLATGVVGMVLGDDRPDLGVAPISAVILGVTAAVIVLSSLIDWYLILPRVSGMLGIRPCRRPNASFARNPKTWREVTRWWYIHRIAAALALRFGLSFAIAFTVARHTSIPYGGSVVAGAAAGLFAGYVAAVPRAVMQAGHVSLIVGRTVVRRDVHRHPRSISFLGRRTRLPFLTQAIVGEFRAREYVYDVAMEAAQLVTAAKREADDLPHGEDGELEYESDPNKLLVKDIDASTPEPAEPFAGCNRRCSGVNWYCIDNPRLFRAQVAQHSSPKRAGLDEDVWARGKTWGKAPQVALPNLGQTRFAGGRFTPQYN